MGIICFLTLILLPYAAEQYAYWKFTVNNRAKELHPPAQTVSGYGWAYLWDAAHFAVLVAAGFKMIAGHRPLTWEWVGCAVFWLGVLLRIWALRELGPFYAAGLIIQAHHQVIDTGPYRYVRHPLHLGTSVQIIGLAFFAPLWLALPAVGVSLALTVLKDRAEDRTLLRNLSAYLPYYAETWDLADIFFKKECVERGSPTSGYGNETRS